MQQKKAPRHVISSLDPYPRSEAPPQRRSNMCLGRVEPHRCLNCQFPFFYKHAAAVSWSKRSGAGNDSGLKRDDRPYMHTRSVPGSYKTVVVWQARVVSHQGRKFVVIHTHTPLIHVKVPLQDPLLKSIRDLGRLENILDRRLHSRNTSSSYVLWMRRRRGNGRTAAVDRRRSLRPGSELIRPVESFTYTSRQHIRPLL